MENSRNSDALVANLCVWIAALIAFSPSQALAVPSFSTQTGQACAACHVGSFGPQLTPYGRAFKLNGYTQNDGDSHPLPLALMLQSSYTTTKKSQNPPPSGFGPNNNFSLDQVSAFYAGAITSSVGAFVQATYNGVDNVAHWDNMDIRYAHPDTLLGVDYVAGLTLNNGPTVQDLWNSTPAWGFPYATTALGYTPTAATLIDNGLAQTVLGGGAYASINNWVFLEADAYRGLGQNTLNALGNNVANDPVLDGFIPYWRVALEHQFGGHYFEVGTFGITANKFPAGLAGTGPTDQYVDNAFDATYQWLDDPENIVSAHTTFIHERQNLNGSYAAQLSANSSDTLNTFRTDVSYSYKNTYTPSLQYFKTTGSVDTGLYGGIANGNPNTEGYIAELAYAPFGKDDSPMPWFNGRLALQYIGYTRFDGTSKKAADNNAIFVNLWLALDPVTAFGK